jgi:hypothetical protein
MQSGWNKEVLVSKVRTASAGLTEFDGYGESDRKLQKREVDLGVGK